MSKIRAQVSTHRAADLPIDHIVNTVYFDDFNIDPTGGTNWQTIANDIRGAFNARDTQPGGYGCEVKVYNMADAEPRPVKAAAPWVASGSGSGASAAREVSLCLSYFSERNLPRFRGRLYIGPMVNALERPTPYVVNSLIALADRLAAIGGPDVDWQLYSPTRGAFSKITDVWVDDEWDTIRSRGLRATTRSRKATGE
jgi:hypothetical protein